MEIVKTVVLDANILMRAVLGIHVQHLLDEYAGSVWFCAPQIVFDDARRNLGYVGSRRGWDEEKQDSAIEALDAIRAPLQPSD